MTDVDDVITLRGLSAAGRHGVYPFEREGVQSFTVDLSLWVDTRAAAASDDLELTVDYGQIAEEVAAVLEGPSVYLLETLAQRVAEAALSHPRVRAVEVTVHKPMAPLRQQFTDVALTIRRTAAPPASSARLDDEDVPVARISRDEAIAADAGGGRAVAAGDEVAPLRSPQIGRRSTRDQETGHRDAGRQVVLALGGNLGDAPTTLARAVGQLMDVDGLEIDDVSPVVRTRPVLEPGQGPQPDYWNAVVLARTWLEPHALLDATSAIEQRLGRERHEHWGARTLDIDIVQLQGMRSDDPALTLPHPGARSRAFVLVPWHLVDPDAVLEGVGRVDLLARVAPDRDGVVDAVSDWLEEPESVADESDQILAGRSIPPVLATPAGGSVVAAVAPVPRAAPPTQAREWPSRVDQVPEAVQEDLRPDGTGADYLWRKLRAQWESASGAPATVVPLGNAVRDDTSSFPATQAGRKEGAYRRTGQAAPPASGPSVAPAAASTGIPAGAASSTRPPGHPSHAAEQGAPAAQDTGAHRTPKWVPVRRGALRPRPGVSADPVAPASTGHGSETTGTPSLPAWDSPSHEDVRIVDDSRDLAPAGRDAADVSTPSPIDGGEAERGADSVTQRRSILDPRLPPSTPTGPLEHDDSHQTTTSIMRRVTVRPTVTGHQPVVGRDGGQP